jgi:hypothetical protein
MPRLHSTLRTSVNIVLLLVYPLVLAATLTIWPASAYSAVLIAIGAVGGTAAGFMQRRAFNDNQQAFATASTALEIRGILAAHPWGRCYLFLFWGMNAAYLLAGFLLGLEPAQAVLLGYAPFCIVRELITLPVVRALERLENNPPSRNDVEAGN